jgi:hypothetical protein
MNRPTLDKLTDHAAVDIEIGGRPYTFRELSVDALGRLQADIKRLCPSPVARIMPQLEGLPPRDRDKMLEFAYREAQAWPPVVGTAEGAAALLSTEPGQVAVLHEGLKASDPDTTLDEAAAVYRQLRRDAARQAKAARAAGRRYDGEGVAKRIFGVLFDVEDSGDESPKGQGPGAAASPSTGPCFSGSASNGSG